MQKPERFAEIEDALTRLMPVGVSESMQSEIEDQLEELCGDAEVAAPSVVKFPKWIAASGIAAAVVLGFVFFPRPGNADGDLTSRQVVAISEAPGVVVLDETADRVERVSDEGLFVDSGGSAVRKVRVRVIGESMMRDEETGIVVTLAEPREEMYLVPVSTF